MIILLNENLLNSENKKKLSKKLLCKKLNEINKKNYKNVVAIYTKLESKINKIDIIKFPNLRYILSPTTGLNHIDEKI